MFYVQTKCAAVETVSAETEAPAGDCHVGADAPPRNDIVGSACKAGVPAATVMKSLSEEELAAINRYTRRALTAEEVYTFPVTLCNDQPDRDCERFSVDCLEGLAPLFEGRTILFDHSWSAKGQTARIYATEVVEEGGVTKLTAKIYMPRLPETEHLVSLIDSGILKEISVGCAVGKTTCSICGENYCSCDHRRGMTYDGEVCYVILSEPTDAYEASFVAVPAQPEAGVQKAAERQTMSITDAERAKARLRIEKLRFGGIV